MQKLDTKHKLTGKLTFQQINYIKLLQVSACDMSSRIAEEIEDNPILEESENSDLNSEDYNINSYKSKHSNYNDFNYKNIPLTHSFKDKLLQQLELSDLKGDDYKIGKHIIGSIDSDGYLRISVDDVIDEFAFNYYMDIKSEQVEKIINVIQTFDPIGVAARDLQECLALQLNKLDDDKKEIKIAKLIIKECFHDFANKHYNKINEKLNLKNEEDLKSAINIIKNLNPKPGKAFSHASNNNSFIFPDFIVTKENNKLNISLSKDNIPNLRINKSYGELCQNDKDKEASSFIKKKINSARWFIDAIKQRQATMLKTMNAIVKLQNDFFEDEEESNLRPLILKDIASEIDMDISTVSRVTNNKYVQTNYGIYPLKFFFSESIKKMDGTEVSSREVKEAINEIILNENKRAPYTDEKITTILNDKGYKIARRTVSKYREQLKLPVTRLRKGI
ncbi:MAG: RNA polymerase factor sigma-54 [Bacteroidetes bacterium]|nr:RNA polymerase factor sigma-54 [Bacteroidota bacterium]